MNKIDKTILEVLVPIFGKPKYFKSKINFETEDGVFELNSSDIKKLCDEKRCIKKGIRIFENGLFCELHGQGAYIPKEWIKHGITCQWPRFNDSIFNFFEHFC